MVDTIIIGLDAANPPTIDKLVDRGDLPTIGNVLSGGASGVLQSTVPPMTPAAWTSISTGVNPGKHGIFDFLEQSPEDHQIHPTDYNNNSYPELWKLLEYFGEGVGVLNYPVVYPPSEAGEFFVSGIPASNSDQICRPECLRDVLEEYDFRLTPDVSPEDGDKEYYDELVDLTAAQKDCIVELTESTDLDVFATVFMGLDWAQHYLWDANIEGENAVEKLYQEVDGMLEGILETVGEDTNVLLISDHGAGPIEGEVHLNSWLEENGYLETRDHGGLSSSIRQSIFETLWQMGARLPDAVQRFVKRTGPDSILSEVKREAHLGQMGMEEQIDWDRTVASSYGYMGKISINSDADPGAVSANGSTIEDLKSALISDVSELADPRSNQQIVSNVFRREDLYNGEMTGQAPDLQLEIADWRYMVYGDFAESWFHEPQDRIADHTSEGFFALNGSDIKSQDGLEIDAIDVAPLVLTMHGHPILEEMDGLPQASLFEQAPDVQEVSMESVATDAHSSKGHGDEVRDRLEDLGYI